MGWYGLRGCVRLRALLFVGLDADPSCQNALNLVVHPNGFDPRNVKRERMVCTDAFASFHNYASRGRAARCR